MTTKDFDAILQHVGEFGRYQKLRFATLCLISGCYLGWGTGYTMFTIMATNHWCNLPPKEELPAEMQNLTKQKLQELLIPGWDQPGKRQSCYIRNASAFLDRSDIQNISDVQWIPCAHGWEFDPGGRLMLDAEFKLVCSDDYLLSLMITLSGAPSMIGRFFWVHLADIVGRKAVIFITWFFQLACNLAAGFSPNFLTYWILHGVAEALFEGTLYILPCILAMEFIGPEHHSIIVNLSGIAFAVGTASFAPVAYLCQTWRQLLFVFNLTFLPVMIFCFFTLDESPRWLISRGKSEQAIKILKKMSRINGTDISAAKIEAWLTETEEIGSDLRKENGNLLEKSIECDGQSKNEKPDRKLMGLLSLFSTLNLALITMTLAYVGSAIQIVYYALTYNIPNFGGNRYLLFALMSLMEIPACIINMVSDKIGRIFPFGMSFFISGMTLLSASFIPSQLTLHMGCLAVMANFSITVAFNLFYQVGGELFPTVLRSTGIGFASVIADILCSAAPFIAYSSVIFRALPTLLMAGIAMMGGFLVLFLPETMHSALPETIEDLKFGMKSFIENVCCKSLRNFKK